MPVRTLILFLIMLAAPFSSAYARVDILPRIIVMEPRDRSGEITILNLFDDPSLYRIEYLNYRQNSDGTYTTLEQPLSEFFDPEKIVRLSPRQFTLQPQGRQKIRLSLRKPEALPEGEYRFHILAQRRELKDIERTAETKEDRISIQMKMNIGVAIPVVVRHGDTQVEAKITDAQYVAPNQANKQRPGLAISVMREGNASSIGSLSVFSGEERIGFISNFNIFTEINQRNVEVPLKIDPQGKSGLRVVYQTESGQVFDEILIP